MLHKKRAKSGKKAEKSGKKRSLSLVHLKTPLSLHSREQFPEKSFFVPTV